MSHYFAGRFVALITSTSFLTSCDYGVSFRENKEVLKGVRWTQITADTSGTVFMAGGQVSSGEYQYFVGSVKPPGMLGTEATHRHHVTVDNFRQKEIVAAPTSPQLSSPQWTASTLPAAPHRVCMSSNGRMLGAAVNYGGIHFSSDFGASWTQSSVSGSDMTLWADLECSASGQHMVASARFPRSRVAVSHDFGHSWSEPLEDIAFPTSLALSSDGSQLIVCDNHALYRANLTAAALSSGKTAYESIALASSSTSLKRISMDRGDRLFVFVDTVVLISDNFGGNFTNIAALAPYQHAWDSVSFSMNRAVSFAVSSVNPTLAIYSTDMGLTWNESQFSFPFNSTISLFTADFKTGL